MHLEGNYIATRIKTIFNIDEQTFTEQITEIEYNIRKITDTQYLVIQTNLFNDDIDYLLFFENENGFLSSSLGGIDNIYKNCDDDFVHSWSIPVNSENELINASAVLKKIY